MTERTVATQAELDAALADTAVTTVYITSPDGVWLTIRSGQQRGSSLIQRLLDWWDDRQARRRGRDQIGVRAAMRRHPAGKRRQP